MLRKFMYANTQFRDMKNPIVIKERYWGSSAPGMQGMSRKKKYISKTNNFV